MLSYIQDIKTSECFFHNSEVLQRDFLKFIADLP